MCMQHDKCNCFRNEIILIIFIRTNYFWGLLETIRIALKFCFEFLSRCLISMQHDKCDCFCNEIVLIIFGDYY